MISANLPILHVIIPLIGAPLGLLLSRSPTGAWLLALIISWFTLADSLALLLMVSGERSSVTKSGTGRRLGASNTGSICSPLT